MNTLSVNELINNLSKTKTLLLLNKNLEKKISELKTSLNFSNYFIWYFSLKKSLLINAILVGIANAYLNSDVISKKNIANVILSIYFKIGFILIYLPSKIFHILGSYSLKDFSFNSSDKDIPPFVIGWIIGILILYLIVNFILTKISEIKFKQDEIKHKDIFKKNSEEKNRLKIKINNNLIKIRDTTILPQDYCYNLNAVNCFLSYLINRRADTLKECINLYHQELQHQEMMDYVGSVESDLYDLKSETESLSNENYQLRKEVQDLKNN